jgi:hypothetical protein
MVQVLARIVAQHSACSLGLSWKVGVKVEEALFQAKAKQPPSAWSSDSRAQDLASGKEHAMIFTKPEFDDGMPYKRKDYLNPLRNKYLRLPNNPAC